MEGAYSFYAQLLLSVFAKTHIETAVLQHLCLFSHSNDVPENGHLVLAAFGCAVWLSGQRVAGRLGNARGITCECRRNNTKSPTN